jgi:hypothetical protein
MALNYGTRPKGSVIRHVVIHTNQGPNPSNDSPDKTAENLGRYLTSTANTKDPVSYHVLVDDDSSVNYLPDSAEAWAAYGSNPIGLHLCFTGYAEWSRDEWLLHAGMLSLGAAHVRAWCLQYNIPMMKLTSRDVALNFWGVIGHVNWTEGKQQGTHTDPGVDFPWDFFIALVKGTPIEKDEDVEMKIDNYPITGKGGMVLLYPIGSAGADNVEAWFSASSFSPMAKGWVEVYAQSDIGGKQHWLWSEKELNPNDQNLRKRPGIYLVDGVTKLVVTWDLSTSEHGGTLCVEYRKKPAKTT